MRLSRVPLCPLTCCCHLQIRAVPGKPGQDTAGNLSCGPWFSQEQVGMLMYAGSAFCGAMMTITARLAHTSGVSTWEVIFVRSVIMGGWSLWQLIAGRHSVIGTRYARCSPQLPGNSSGLVHDSAPATDCVARVQVPQSLSGCWMHQLSSPSFIKPWIASKQSIMMLFALKHSTISGAGVQC